jgi:signal transduction histidine kinase
LKQIILNLLSNAVKFTPQGGRVTVEVCLKPGPGLEISVVDNGIGIEAGDIPTALRPFGQVAGSHSRGHEGTGLGLPISNALMRLHGGSLVIESRVGVGTRATIRFNEDRILECGELCGEELVAGIR